MLHYFKVAILNRWPLYLGVTNYFLHVLQDCCICCDSLKSSGLSDNGGGGEEHDPVFKLNKCDHMFHKSCLVAMYNSGAKVSATCSQSPYKPTLRGVTCSQSPVQTYSPRCNMFTVPGTNLPSLV